MRGKKRPTADRTRALAVAAREGVAEASRQTGLAKSTIHQWMQTPEYEQLRTRTKDQVAEEWWAIVQQGFRRTAELLARTEDVQKAATATAIIFDKLALSRGEATARTESRSLTDALNDNERKRLRDWIDKLDLTADSPAEGVAAGAGPEVR